MSAAARGHRTALTENRTLRLATFFLFYFGQGLPAGLTATALPAWLASNGAPDAAVGAIVATAYLPWSFKFVIAALMDRYAYLPMGRRRLWLIMAQVLMTGGFLIAALLAPGPHNYQLLTYVTFLVMAGAATQDVAVDGMAVDILADREQGTASAVMFGGQALGIAAAGAGGGYLLQHYGSATAFLAFLPPIALITLFAVALRERPGERRFPWSAGEIAAENRDRHVGAWIPIFLVTLKSLVKRDSLILVVGSSFFRAAGGLITPLIPILGTTMVGYTTATYSGTVSTIDLALAVIAIGAGSFLTVRLGPKYASILVLLVLGGWCAYTLLGKSLWLTTAGFLAGYVVYSLFTTLSAITTNPLRMQLSDPRVAATQFTIYNSLSNLPVSLGATLFGVLGGAKNLATVMEVTIGMFLVSSLILWFMRAGEDAAESELVEEFD
jgi:PAT family beta-lactamase induction signal transducer AmpG